MSIKDKPQPSRSRQIGNILLLVSGAFLLFNLAAPFIFGPQIPRVPYSMFINQVQDGEVSRASVGQNEIRYQLKGTDNQPGADYYQLHQYLIWTYPNAWKIME